MVARRLKIRYAVGFVVARCQATHPSAVYAGAGRGRGGTVSRRTVGQRAAQDGLDAGGSGRRSSPWRQQAILGRGQWDADALRDIVREYALETLGDEDAVLVIDETGFLKQGKASCGVARQYTGSAGKITNCQIGVFAAYVSRHGHAFIDRALYLPKDWTDDRSPEGRACPERCGLCHEAQDRASHDRSRDRRQGAILVRGDGRDRNPTAQGGQGLCSRCCFQSCVPILGQAAACRRHRRHDRAKPSQEGLAPPVIRRRNQRSALARLGLSRIGRPRSQGIQR
ncbi:hypothetical protein DAA51_00085 [Bradyrhizobium sp. WBAH10]|nr:hypothetical protein [Bradyrhizobium sp. WBAH41]NRB90696.1 hypothetical protein [Bradyrhizobium sp. WBAH10]QCJ72382.1 hypothetical protein DAA51_00085 [Bradyrhizobium sp. WBAH10]QCK01822.1 hypothetical protein DAB18_00085 [Bradyrhizobium sp. WBAH41]